MKRLAALVLTAALAFYCGVAAFAQDIKIIIGGEELESDAEPFIDKSNRILVPFRAVFEEFGAVVEWNVKTKSILCIKDDLTIKLTIDSDKMLVNGQEIILDSPACIFDGHTYVPLRAISECMGANVVWDYTEKTAYIDFPKSFFDANNVQLEKTEELNKTIKVKGDIGDIYIFEGEVKYDVISGKAKGIEKINKEIKDTADFIIYMAATSYGTADESAIERYTETGQYNTMSAEVAVKYANNDYISYISSVKSMVGGVNPIETKQGGVFDLNTGKLVSLDKILSDKEAVLMAAEEKFYDLIEKNPDIYYSNVEINMDNAYYYLTEKGIVFGFNKQEIAPYSTGFVEVEVSR